MQVLFLLIVEGFTKFLSFFSKFQVWQNVETAFKAARFISKKALLAILVALTVTYFALLIAFVYFTFEAVTTAYNLISSLLTQIESGISTNLGSELMKAFYYILNVSGIVTGIQAVFPFIASALTFRLMKPVKTVFLFLYDKFKNAAFDMVKIVTAA